MFLRLRRSGGWYCVGGRVYRVLALLMYVSYDRDPAGSCRTST